jgi:hypothetical protein
MKTNFQLSLSTAIASVLMLICSTAHSQILFASDIYGHIYNQTTPGRVSTFATLPTQPTSMAFDPSGNLFVTQYDLAHNVGNIVEITPGGIQSIFATGMIHPSALAFDRAGNLFAADAISGNIYEYTPSGARSTFASGLSSPYGLAFNSAGNLFASTGSNITEFTPTGAQSIFALGIAFADAGALAFDSSGNLFASVFRPYGIGGQIVEVTTNGVATTFASGVEPLNMAFDNAGNLFAADGETIDEFTPAGVQSIFVTGVYWNGVAFQGITLPVPEPSSLALGLGALFVFVAWRTLLCKSRWMLFNHRDSVHT